MSRSSEKTAFEKPVVVPSKVDSLTYYTRNSAGKLEAEMVPNLSPPKLPSNRVSAPIDMLNAAPSEAAQRPSFSLLRPELPPTENLTDIQSFERDMEASWDAVLVLISDPKSAKSVLDMFKETNGYKDKRLNLDGLSNGLRKLGAILTPVQIRSLRDALDANKDGNSFASYTNGPTAYS